MDPVEDATWTDLVAELAQAQPWLHRQGDEAQVLGAPGADVVAELASAGSGVGVGSWAATTVVGSDVEIEILLEAHRM